jgi:hypothetical protein
VNSLAGQYSVAGVFGRKGDGALRHRQEQVLEQRKQEARWNRYPAPAPGVKAQEGQSGLREYPLAQDREDDARLDPLDAGEICVMSDVVDEIRDIEQYPCLDRRRRTHEHARPGRCPQLGHQVRCLGETVVVEIDRRAGHDCAAVSAAKMQGMAAFRQHFVWKFDTEPVPSIANAALHKLRPMVACDRRDQGGFTIDQLEPDPLSGHLWIPNPAVDRSPIHCVDMTLKPAIGLAWL